MHIDEDVDGVDLGDRGSSSSKVAFSFDGSGGDGSNGGDDFVVGSSISKVCGDDGEG